MNARFLLHSRQRGFTFIELLVSIGIMMLMVGGGIAAYISFNDRQTVVAGGKQVQSYLRLAQKKARAGDAPSGCERLESYAVRLTAGSPTLQLVAVCTNDEFEESDTLPTGVTSNSTVDMRFRVLLGGVENPGTITVSSSSLSYQLVVRAAGEINNGDIVPIESE